LIGKKKARKMQEKVSAAPEVLLQKVLSLDSPSRSLGLSFSIIVREGREQVGRSSGEKRRKCHWIAGTLNGCQKG